MARRTVNLTFCVGISKSLHGAEALRLRPSEQFSLTETLLEENIWVTISLYSMF
jgi:hypothetical protein